MTTRHALSSAGWLAAVALVVLAARSVAYGLAEPSPLQAGLRQAAGGPRLVTVTMAALGLGVGVAAAVVWLASIAVRERAALRGIEAPTLRLLRVTARALGLTLSTCAGFAALESYLHLRAGLPWHGIECLTGPVHAGALPILAGLSVLAAAAIEAARHVLRWMRRTLRLLVERPKRIGRPVPLLAVLVALVVPPSLRPAAALARPPPHSGS